MKRRFKVYLRINLITLLFLIVSFISLTLAWFAYTGIMRVSTEIDVKVWYIELKKNDETVTNNLILSLTELYPGMETIGEVINIKNLGDSDAQVKYSIMSARILGTPEDNYVIDEDLITSEYVKDRLSHEYPFHINMNLSKGYVLARGGEATFEVSISWPLDSDTDLFDSFWGTEAYKFQVSEQEKKMADPEYKVRPAIEIVINIAAEQYIEEDTTSDLRYNLGDEVLFDVVNNQVCTEISSTCIKTYILDVNNTLGDNVVTLLPDPNIEYLSSVFSDYNDAFSTITNNWTVTTRPLLAEDLLKVISVDMINSVLVRENLSDLIIGNVSYENRVYSVMQKAIDYNGYFSFLIDKFAFLKTPSCYWTRSSYNEDNAFAVTVLDDSRLMLYGKEKAASCNVIPVILADKSSFN